jgi:putative transposase
MANTYTQIYLQLVFAVHSREALIKPEFKDEVYKYMTGIVRNNGSKLLAINGMPDHVHLLVGWKPSVDLPSLVKDVKAGSSRFINEKRFLRGRFNWQEGYGAFSYGHSQLTSVIKYIENQEQKHARRSFRTEYMSLLRKFDIAFEEKYAFKELW